MNAQGTMKVVGMLAWLVLLGGCQGSRVAICKTDGDCGGDKKSYCVDSICAQCRGEDDCRSPLICGRDHTCKSLTPSAAGNSSSPSQ